MQGNIIEKNELLSIIPHKGKMVLLNRITAYDLENQTIEAEYDITKECIFYDPQIEGVPTWAGFEFIAQSIAAISGIREKSKNKPPRLGFVLGLSQVFINTPYFKLGSIVKIKTKEIENEYPIMYFTGELFVNDQKIFSGRLTVMEIDDEQKQKFTETLKNE